MPRIIMAAAFVLLVSIQTVMPAAAKDQQAFVQELMALVKMPVNGLNTTFHMERRYEALYNDASLTYDQKAAVLSSWAAFRGAEGDNKVGELALRDQVVAEYPEAKSIDMFRDNRAYAYVQAWYMADRVLNDKKGDESFGDLWNLGYWDDAVDALAKQKQPVKMDSNVVGDLQLAGYIQGSSGKGGGSSIGIKAKVKDERDKVYDINGYARDAPNKKQGSELTATLEALRSKAAQYKTD